MPLRADLDSQPVVASEVSDRVWEQLRLVSRAALERLVFPVCGTGALLRTSPLGTRHFVHRPGTSCAAHPGEGQEHLAAKAVIVAAATAAGWDAVPEQPGSGWVADVLAARGRLRVALEVQWSRQSRERYAERQRAYDADGVRAVWFSAWRTR